VDWSCGSGEGTGKVEKSWEEEEGEEDVEVGWGSHEAGGGGVSEGGDRGWMPSGERGVMKVGSGCE